MRKKNMLTKKTRFAPLVVAILILANFITVFPQKQTSPVAPRREQVEAVVREAYQKFLSDTSGKNADYIPFLAQVDSKMFGIAIVTTDNQIISMGETKYAFSIQSISKV